MGLIILRCQFPSSVYSDDKSFKNCSCHHNFPWHHKSKLSDLAMSRRYVLNTLVLAETEISQSERRLNIASASVIPWWRCKQTLWCFILKNTTWILRDATWLWDVTLVAWRSPSSAKGENTYVLRPTPGDLLLWQRCIRWPKSLWCWAPFTVSVTADMRIKQLSAPHPRHAPLSFQTRFVTLREW